MQFTIETSNGIPYTTLGNLLKDMPGLKFLIEYTPNNTIVKLNGVSGFGLNFWSVDELIGFLKSYNEDFIAESNVINIEPYHVYMALDRLEYLKKTFPKLFILVITYKPL